MLVAVTGATGFIGRRLCARLRAEGRDVRALARRPAALPGDDAETVRGDLDDATALRTLVAGADAVVHLAGAVRGADRAAFDAVNVVGTQNLLDAVARAAPETRFLHVSTLAAREPGLSDYAGSKRAAEALVSAAAVPSTILRPTAVYGPGDVELQPLLETMARGLATAPGDARNRVTLIHVDDLVDALLAVLAAPTPARGPFELCDGVAAGYDWPELAAAVARHSGRSVRVLTVPGALLRSAGLVNRALARLTGRAPMLTPGKARELTHPDWRCDPEPFTAAFAWQPRIDLARGLATVLP
ncbi:MAG: NAD-dependent epimerase/dehydratase family protein [Pseudomonadales bacterium]|jgi:nucleoside-diphosphate-sugar epimerase|nr:NAD-dependent epimerase/dehydratase family protein [Pseudomonadales bacterium]